jgi:hypothetical protein
MFHYIRLDKLSWNKHSSLLGSLVNHLELKCYEWDPWNLPSVAPTV